MNTKHKLLAFEGNWLLSFGKPEAKGVWLIWGPPGSGKTSFVMQLVKYLAGFCQINKVAYDSLEEGNSQSIKMALDRINMIDVSDKFLLLDQEPIGELKDRLRKKRSPRVAVIDSVQYSGLNYPDYVRLRTEFPEKLFLIISHADGRNPYGKTAKGIWYDAFVKVRVEGYAAFAVSRYTNGESQPFQIWPEGAKKYHGTSILKAV